MVGAIPFSVLLLSFIIVWIRRKIDDYFLKWTIAIFIAAMALRVGMSVILIAITETSNND